MSGETQNSDNSPPPKFNRAVETASADEGGFPWLRLVAGVFFLLIAGGAFYQFYWKYRLPQERALVDRDGKHIQAKLTARNGEILQYTDMKDGNNHYIAIESLADDDQAFVQGLASALVLAFPVDATLTNKKGEPIQGSVQARNTQYFKLTMGADGAMHYMALADLSADDEKWLKLLPGGMTFTYPVGYTLTYPDGRTADVRIISRSDTLAKIQMIMDGAVHVYPIETLSAVDQAFVRALPVSTTLTYPVELTLEPKSGKAFPANIIGRSDDTVRYTLLNEKALHNDPLAQFSGKNQEFLKSLPANFQDSFSPERTLTTGKGESIKAHLLGRTLALAKFTNEADDNIYYLPLETLSADDQEYIRRMPADLRIEYPTEYTLTDPKGAAVPVRLLGHTDDAVKFVMISSGKTFDSSMKSLSPLDQTILNQFPIIQEAAPVAAQAPAQSAPVSAKSIAAQVVASLQNSGSYGGDTAARNAYRGGKLPRDMSGNAWTWMMRLSGRSSDSSDYIAEFKNQPELRTFLKKTLQKGVNDLQGIRTNANATQVDDLISSAQHAIDAIDALAGSGSGLNRADSLAAFVSTWQSAR